MGIALKLHAISTFNAAGLDLYGRKMIETFGRFWPDEVPLTIYSEGFDEAPAPANEIDLLKASPWLADFKKRHASRVVTSFLFDAVRFSHKVAAVLHAARNTDADVLIWIDGDSFTHSVISASDLEALAPKGGEWIAWLDRAKSYPECGFYMLNLRHPQSAEMLASLEAMYADDELFALKEFHDSYVLEQVVKRAGVGTKSLSGEGHGTFHPLINGPLGKWFDHLKGDRKGLRRSHKADLRVRRDEAHWR